MQVCLYCVQRNYEGVLFCERCGSALYENRDGITYNTMQSKDREMLRRAAQGSGHLAEQQQVFMYLRNGEHPITIPDTGQIVIGRIGTNDLHVPDIDLTPYGAYQHGVSRRHAAILHRGRQVLMKDLNSRHGTTLNGQQLESLKNYVLRDGDEVHFAGIVAHIYFENVYIRQTVSV